MLIYIRVSLLTKPTATDGLDAGWSLSRGDDPTPAAGQAGGHLVPALDPYTHQSGEDNLNCMLQVNLTNHIFKFAVR